MFDSITTQIRQLDRDIDLCKERLHALKKSHPNKTSGKCKNKISNLKRSKSAMNRRVPAERDFSCKKHSKPEKPGNCVKKNKETNDISCLRNQKVKLRSRSASCGRECPCDCLNENNYHHNDLILNKPEERVRKKNSWASILKEQNKQVDTKPSLLSNKKVNLDCNQVMYPTSIYLKNKGVQCSDVSFFPSKSVITSNTQFTPYEPTRTLQFLMNEIKENLKNKREDKIYNIINDMENTIYRIKSNPDYSPSTGTKFNSNYNFKAPLNNVQSQLEINKVLEEGFSKLEATCKTLEITCSRLKEENKQLSLELKKKEACISVIEKRECENNAKIDLLNKHILSISSKGSEYSQSLQDLTKLLAKLQQENKCIEPLKELNMRMESKLTELTKEKNTSLYENKLLQLENEKLKVLLEMKEKQLNSYKDAFCGLEDKINEEVQVMQGRCVSEESDPESSAPLCSSPNTSASLMAPVYGSWQVVSGISSKAESTQNSPPVSLDCPLPSKNNGRKQLGSINYQIFPCKISEKSPFEEQIHVKPGFDIQTNQDPLMDLNNIRSEIKKLCHDPNPELVDSVNPNAQYQWINLNSVRTEQLNSMTTFHTTT